MEGLVLLLRLVALVAAGALALEIVRRQRGRLWPTKRKSRRPECPHLGFATNPFDHHNGATDEHRCYASLARERIDLGHQRQFCLASTYNRCPFLLVQAEQEGLLERIWAWRRIVSPVRQALPTAATLASLRHTPGRVLVAQAARATAELPFVVVRASRVAWSIITPVIARAAAWLALRLLVVARRAHFAVTMASSRQRSTKLVQRLAATSPKLEEVPAHLQVLVAPTPPVEVAPMAELAPVADVAPIAEQDTVERGIAALEAGDEVEARALFKRATERYPNAARAWFWRAKTADTLDEVIACLEQANTREPDNALIASNLVLAVQRREALRTSPAPVPVPLAAVQTPEPLMLRSSLVHRVAWAAIDVCRAVGALAAFLIGTTWLLSALPPSLRSAFADASGLQALPLPDARALTGLLHLSLGGFDLGSTLPYGVGFLALFIGLGLLRDERWTRVWAPLLGIGSGWVWIASAAGAPPPDTLMVLACGLLAVGGAVTGWTVLPGSAGAPSMTFRSAHPLGA